MIEKIELSSADSTNPKSVTVVQKTKIQKTVNPILIISAVFIMIAVVSSFFVEELGSIVNITLKDLTSDGLVLAIASFSVSILWKQVSINRAKLTDIYKKTKEKTDKKLKAYANEGLLLYADEYCEDYEKVSLERDRKRIIEAVGLTYKDYESQYLAKSIFYLRKINKDLSLKQLWAIYRANRVRRISYNPDFLRTTIHVRKSVSPSEAYDTDKKNAIDTLKTLIYSMLGGGYAVSIAQDLIVSFSIAALVSAGIRLAIIVMTSAFRASVGWNLITVTEVNRLASQDKEAIECIKWSMKNYPNDFQGKTIPTDDDNDEG